VGIRIPTETAIAESGTEYECCKVADAILERVVKRARAMMAKRARAEAKRGEE
jgi:hypothetical protein